MPRMKILGISGKIGSGKSTAAKHVIENYRAQTLSFAQPLKDEVFDFLLYCNARVAHTGAPFETRHIWGSQKDKDEPLYVDLVDLPQQLEYKRVFEFMIEHANVIEDCTFIFTPRALLQWWGTEFRRASDPNYWVNKAFASVEEYKDKAIIFVIEDVRFENEAEAILAAGGVIVRIERFDNPHITEENQKHLSETALDRYPKFSAQIANNSDKEAFLAAVDCVVGALCALDDLERA